MIYNTCHENMRMHVRCNLIGLNFKWLLLPCFSTKQDGIKNIDRHNGLLQEGMVIMHVRARAMSKIV